MALNTKPSPPRTFNREEAQQWYKLLRAIEFELTGAGLANTLYVDLLTGDNATAERGSLVFKYETIQAALDAAQTGDVVFVSPGSYVEDIVWPATEDVTLRGSGRGATTITNSSAGTPTIAIAPAGAALVRATIEDLNLVNTVAGASPCIVADAATGNQPDSFNSLTLQKLMTQAGAGGGNDIDVTTAIRVYLTDIQAEGGITLNEVGSAIYENLDVDSLTVGYDATAVEPTGGRGPHAGTGILVAQAFTVNNQAWVALGAESAVGAIAGSLTDTAAAYGIIDFQGRCTGNCVVAFEFTEAGLDPHVGVRLDSAELAGALQVADTGVAGTQRCVVHARHALLQNETADVNQAGDLTDMDLRGAQFAQDSLSVAGNGAIDRTNWVQLIEQGQTTNVTENWANAGGNVPYVTAPEHVAVEGDLIVDLPVQVTSKSTSQIQILKTADTGNILVNAYLGGV